MTIARTFLGMAVLLLPVLSHARSGDLDDGWGSGGVVRTDLGTTDDGPKDVAVQPDGKVLVVAGQTLIRVVRYATDGTLDPTFGIGGIAVTSAPPAFPSKGRAVAIAGAGRILVATDDVLVRYDASGVLDPGFAVGGVAAIDWGDYSVQVSDVVIAPDGRIVVTGMRSAASNSDIVLARFAADGSLDPTFGTDGFATADVSPNDFGLALARQADGKLVVLGTTSLGPVVVRFDDGGTLDPAFGSGGVVLLDDGPQFAALALQADGGILVAGRSSGSLPQVFLTRRLDANGNPDTTFGGTGSVTTPQGGTRETAEGMVVQPDGKIVVSGKASVLLNEALFDLALVRYLPNGDLDESFGSGGVARTSVGDNQFVNTALAIAPDGRLIAAGSLGPVGSTDLAVYRYLGGTCGNAAVEPGESCDGGDPLGSTCCPADCVATTAGAACDEDGAFPYTADACDGAGSCAHVVALQPGCKHTLTRGRSRLVLDASARQLNWAWRGEATTLAELADPVAQHTYALSVFQGASGLPVLDVVAPAGGTCGTRPCWTPTQSAGFRYRDRTGARDGIKRLMLRAGAADANRLALSSSGPNLLLPPLALALPVRVQLQSANGHCWEATYSASSVNTAVRFSGRSD